MIKLGDSDPPDWFPDDDPRPPQSPTAATAAFFGPESPLRKAVAIGARQYEERPAQREMAEAVAESLTLGEHLCVEAPTGVGKSFAYLVPAIHYAKATGKPVVITTHTIALQEQLIEKDIPFLRRCLGIEFRAALAKGRDNYVCLDRLNRASKDHRTYLPVESMVPDLERIRDWALDTRDGTRSNLPFRPAADLWSSVCAEPGTCTLANDERAGECFFQRARKRLFTADVIIANHALFCIDLAMKEESETGQGILPEYGAVIVDEAHTFEDVAANHLGARASSWGVLMLLGRLFNTRTSRGLLTHHKALEAREAVAAFTAVATRFFEQLLHWVEKQQANPLPYATPYHIPNPLNDAFVPVQKALRELLAPDNLPPSEDAFRGEVRSLATRLGENMRTIDAFLSVAVPDAVYWFERVGRHNQYISMNIVPVAVGDILRDLLFDNTFPVVMTSATLAVERKIDFFQRRVGAERAKPLILESPFNFREQVTLYLPSRDAPQPRDERAFHVSTTAAVKQFVAHSSGRAFVLFTSYAAMNRMADDLSAWFAEQGYRLLVQGRDQQRTRMLEIFREDISSVLFGTDSFWMGVDVPGEALSNVTIVKLPFSVPSHPLAQARKQRLEEAGGNAFRDLFLPEAILKFRQGVGRLIRTQDDRGIIAILDPRIATAGYGKAFLRSLPDCTIAPEGPPVIPLAENAEAESENAEEEEEDF